MTHLVFAKNVPPSNGSDSRSRKSNSFPGVTEVIEALLHAVLDNLQRSLEAGIAKDFEVWKAEDAARQAQLGAENVNVSAVE